jgi:hypothetical protein
MKTNLSKGRAKHHCEDGRVGANNRNNSTPTGVGGGSRFLKTYQEEPSCPAVRPEVVRHERRPVKWFFITAVGGIKQSRARF